MENINIKKIYKYINPFKDNNILKIDKNEITNYLLSNNIYSYDNQENKDNLYKKITYLIANTDILDSSYISINIPSNENEFNKLFDKYSDNYAIYVAHLLLNKESINIDFNGSSKDLKTIFNINIKKNNLSFSNDYFKINNTLNLNYVHELNSINFWSNLDYCLENISKDNFLISWPLISDDVKENSAFIDKIIKFISYRSSNEKDLDQELMHHTIIEKYKYHSYEDGSLFIDKLFKNSSPSFYSFILFNFYINDFVDVFENNKKINNFNKIYDFFNQSNVLLELLKNSNSESEFNDKLSWEKNIFDIRQVKQYFKFENISTSKYPSDDFYSWFSFNAESYARNINELGYNPFIDNNGFTKLFHSKFPTVKDKLNLIGFCSNLFVKKNNNNEKFIHQFLLLFKDVNEKDLFNYLSTSFLSDPEKSFCIREYYAIHNKKCETYEYIQFIINQAKYAVSVLDITKLALHDLEKVISHSVNYKLIDKINPEYIKSANSHILNDAYIKQNSFESFIELMGEDILYDSSNPNQLSLITKYISSNNKINPKIMDLICNDFKLINHVLDNISQYDFDKLKFTSEQINKPYVAEKYVAKIINDSHTKNINDLITHLSYKKEILQNYNKINITKFSNLESIENLIIFSKGTYLKFINENSFNNKNMLLMISKVLDNPALETNKILLMLPSNVNNLFNSYSIKSNYYEFINKLILNNELNNSLDLSKTSNIKKNKI